MVTARPLNSSTFLAAFSAAVDAILALFSAVTLSFSLALAYFRAILAERNNWFDHEETVFEGDNGCGILLLSESGGYQLRKR